MEHEYVRLNQAEYLDSVRFGLGRIKENAGYGDKQYYKNGRGLPNREAQILGAMAEVAVCKWFGYDYRDETIYQPLVRRDENGKYPAGVLSKPDILGKFEVRRANAPYQPIPIRDKDIQAGAIIIQAYVEYRPVEGDERLIYTPNVHIIGWTDAVIDSRKAKPSRWDSTGFERYMKRDMSLLKAVYAW